MVNKESVKQQIKELLEKYNKVVEEKRLGKYNEEMTKAEFIEPLFEALGWDVRNRTHTDEVTREEKVSKGWVDYGFRIDGIPKFFLEAKSLKADLDKPEYAEQAINYAWHKGCTWAVLTDFEAIKIFNAEWKTANLFQSRFISLDCHQFLEQFDQLWLLSKESFEHGLLDKEAEKWGKKSKKSPVGEQLFSDLTKWRSELSKDILQRNKGINEVDLDESVQRIIDRLIFIRNCEDRELEPPTLLSTVRDWDSQRKGSLAENIVRVFKHFDNEYNSKLFQHHLCDDLDVSNQVLEGIIKELHHTKDRTIKYDFSVLDADVLGNVYEQYLGHILKKTAKRATVEKKHAYRKEQGIYYTPTYIVDYIVRNTLGELLKDKKINVENIRILDPACGSGSFLIKAFDILNEFYIRSEGEHTQTQLDLESGLPFTKKSKILQNNIFGVDLDTRAVEIAQLNLLLKIAEKKQRLPLLQQNIKHGNSLVDDEKIAGDKAFKWEKEFKQIMDKGGFDVVIGNPPYVNIFNMNEVDRNYFQSNYETATNKSDLYAFFIERVIKKLLKTGGYIGFIVSNTWTSIQSFEKLRKLLLENSIIEKIVPLELGVFADATVVPIILIARKISDKEKILKNKIKIVSYKKNEYKLTKELPQEYFLNSPGHVVSFSLDLIGKTIFDKMKNDTIELGNIAKFSLGIKTADNDKFVSLSKKDTCSKKVLKGKYIKRYSLEYHGEWIWYQPAEMMKRKGAGPRKQEYFEVPKKIILQEISGDKIIATLDSDKYFSLDTTNLLYELKSDYKMEFILGLLNSKLINFWYGTQFKGIHVKLNELRRIPIKIVLESQQQPIIKLVDTMLTLNKRLNEIGDKRTDERATVEEEIKRTKTEIDKLVYKLYGITDSEKKIIEESLR